MHTDILMAKIFLILSLLFTVTICADTDEIAQKIFDSKIYPGVKTLEDARKLTHVLISASEIQSSDSTKRTLTPPPPPPEFDCEVLSRGADYVVPTSAAALLPEDIDLYCALGDSITAGIGINDPTLVTEVAIMTNYRGYAFAGGAEEPYESHSTLPSILKKYNPYLEGYAIGDGKETTENAQLNVAVSGATAVDLASQAELLIEKLANFDPQKNKWKYISIFIGGNDLCAACDDKPAYTANMYINYIKEAIAKLLDQGFSNMFISIIIPPDVTALTVFKDLDCVIARKSICHCADDAKAFTQDLQLQYAEILKTGFNNWDKLAGRDDVKIAIQPFLEKTQIPTKMTTTLIKITILGITITIPKEEVKPDRSYFAPDCFHFSRKGHAAAGLALWQNLNEEGEKLNSWTPSATSGDFLCNDGYLQ